MSTISDAMKKKRDEEPRPSAATSGPRVVQVHVPKDHTARNIVLAVVLGAVIVVGAVVGGYALLGRMNAFERSQPSGTPSSSVEPRTTEVREPAAGTGQNETGTTTDSQDRTPVETTSGGSALPTLEGTFPDAVNPVALINGRRVRPGDVVDGYTVVAIEESRVRLERDGETFDLVIE